MIRGRVVPMVGRNRTILVWFEGRHGFQAGKLSDCLAQRVAECLGDA